MNIKFIFLIFFFTLGFLFIKINETFGQQLFKVFDFSPLSTESVTLKDQILIQPFVPLSDNINVISLWLDNPTSSEINFQLLDENDNKLYSKKIILPIIEGKFWGREYQIYLGSNLKFNSNNIYKLKIESLTSSKLRFFVKNSLELISGYENYFYLPESLKPLKINNNETNYFLKTAFYEGQESDPPIITNLEIKQVTTTQTEISFNSNEQIIYTFEYKQINSSTFKLYSKDDFDVCPEKLKKCMISLQVYPSSIYEFKLTASDFWNNSTVISGEFVTLGNSETFSTDNSKTVENINFYNLKNTSTFSRKITTTIEKLETFTSSKNILKHENKRESIEKKETRNENLNLEDLKFKEEEIKKEGKTVKIEKNTTVNLYSKDNKEVKIKTDKTNSLEYQGKSENKKLFVLVYMLIILLILIILFYLNFRYIRKKYERFFNL
jgi:hypothetical protein